MAKFTSETGSSAGKTSKRGDNKLTVEIKKKLAEVIASQVKNLEADLKAMTERERWAVITGLSEYVLPKLARQEQHHTGDITINGIEYLKPNENTAGTNNKAG